MTYVLECKEEFDRLERQNRSPAYDFKQELSDYAPKVAKAKGKMLDAGCGSGIVTRHLAERFPGVEIVGCDFSGLRLKQASQASADYPQIEYRQEDLTRLSFKANEFSGIVCRFVIQHQVRQDQVKTLNEFHRVLKPGGELRIIDLDGFFYNLYPQPPRLAEMLQTLNSNLPLDFHIGRKLPDFLAQAGFDRVAWRIETMQFQGEQLMNEAVQFRERFTQASSLLAQYLGSPENAKEFTEEYVRALSVPQAVLFYNKFIVSAFKAPAVREV